MVLSVWLLARARAYILAVASKLGPDVAVKLNVSALKLRGADFAWLCEVPQEYSCSMPLEGRWIAYADCGTVTYYRGDLSKAVRYSMHVCRPKVHIRRLPLESAFAAICDDRGRPLTRNTLYFWDITSPGDARNSIEYMGPGGFDVIL